MDIYSLMSIEFNIDIPEPPTGIIDPSLLDIYFSFENTTSKRIIDKASKGSLRELIFSTMAIEILSYVSDYSKSNTKKVLVLRKGEHTNRSPLSYVKQLHGKRLISNPKGMSFDSAIFNEDIIESILFNRNIESPHYSYAELIRANYNGTYTWKWESMKLNDDPIIALSQIRQIERDENIIIGGFYDNKFFINPFRALNPQSIYLGNNPIQKLYAYERQLLMNEAMRFFKYSLNLSGKSKEMLSDRYKRMRYAMKPILCDINLVESLDLSKSFDYKQVGNYALLRLGTLILALSRTKKSGSFVLKYGGPTLVAREEFKKAYRYLSDGPALPGDISLQYVRDIDSLFITYSYGVLPRDGDDTFLSISEGYTIKKVADKTYMLAV